MEINLVVIRFSGTWGQMKIKFVEIILIILSVMIFLSYERDSLRKMIPEEVEGWKRKGLSFYDKRNIFDYINGAGELYISYNFKLLMSAQYEKRGAPLIIVDFFDMGTSKDAFGVFTFERGEDEAGVGQNSYYRGGLLTFWKSHFFISIYTEEEREDSKNAIFKIARKIEEAITEKGEIPFLISFIQDEVEEKSIKFFHDQNVLNSHYFLSYENILNLGKNTDCTAGKTSKGEFILLILYPDETKAKTAYRKFMSSFMPGSVNGFEKMENGKWTGIGITKEVLVLVFDSQNLDECKERIEKIKEKIDKWRETNE